MQLSDLAGFARLVAVTTLTMEVKVSPRETGALGTSTENNVLRTISQSLDPPTCVVQWICHLALCAIHAVESTRIPLAAKSTKAIGALTT